MKRWFVSLLFFHSSLVFSNDFSKSICGVDERVPSRDPRIGRSLADMNQPAGCTVTMISDSCAISAGHCTSTFGVVEFNTPESKGGRIQHSSKRDIYVVDRKSIAGPGRSYSLGNDYAVMKLKPNKITGLLPGQAQGHYQVSFRKPMENDFVRITGYGKDSGEPKRNFAQQTHTGKIIGMTKRGEGRILRHVADTMGGNSGSSIINDRTGRIIAIHTNGGCWGENGANSATMIAGHQKLIKALKSCLASE